MIHDNLFLIMFEHCVPVQGIRSCIIQDNLRRKIVRIPVLLYEFILEFNRKQLRDIYESDNYRQYREEFINFLTSEEFAFFSDKPDMFPVVAQGFESPEFINNAIIDFSPLIEPIFKDIIFDLKRLACKHLQVRYYYSPSEKDIINVLETALDSRLVSVDIVLKHGNIITVELINDLVERYPFLKEVYVYDVSEQYINYLIEKDVKFYNGIFFTPDKIHSEKSCGRIKENVFSININSYLLSKKFNNCLYKKISVATNGDIKNCPSAPITFGNVLKNSLFDVVTNHPNVQHLWDITKDMIATCKICEYRYACSDCRIYVEDPDDDYSKPLKCGYNPYTCEWEEWSTNPLKQQAIDYYGMRDILPEFKIKPDYVPDTATNAG